MCVFFEGGRGWSSGFFLWSDDIGDFNLDQFKNCSTLHLDRIYVSSLIFYNLHLFPTPACMMIS